MNDTFLLIQKMLRMARRFRWVALLTAIVIAVIAWVVVLVLPNQFEVTAKVFLDTRSLIRPLLGEMAVDTRMREAETAKLMRKTLLSRANLEVVARETDLHLSVDTPEGFEQLLLNLGNDLKVSGTSRDNIFVMSYRDQDPRVATRVVAALLNIFVERSLGESREDSSSTRQFLDKQIAEYESRLRDAELQLKEFKQENVGLMPSEGSNYFQRLNDVSRQLSEAQLEASEARIRRDELRRQIESVDALFEPAIPLVQKDRPHALDSRITELESTLDQYLLRYTDQHPDVKATRLILEQLLAQREADWSEQEDEGFDGPQEEQRSNKIYQDLKISLGEAEAKAASLQARVSEFTRRKNELKRLVDTVPEVEAELKRLDRDYDINRNHYDELVKRRESLDLSDKAGQSTDDFQFKIIEPPRVPLVPVSPNRPILGAAGLALAIGAGVGLAWLLATLRPTIYTKEDFLAFVDTAVLGTVSRVSGPAQVGARRIGNLCYVASCVGLVGLFAGFIYMQSLDINFLSVLSQSELLSKLTAMGG